MTSQFVILSVMLLITCAATSCVRDGFSEPIVNLYSYPNEICTNMTIANVGEQVHYYGGGFVLILKNIEFTDLTNVRNFPYSSVEHLIIHHDAQDIGELAFRSFRYLRSLEIHDCKFSNNVFKGFEIVTPQGNYFIQLKMSRNNINRIGAICERSRHLETVFLSDNNITDIGKNNFLQCSKLLYLNLSYNAIQRIEPEAFSGLAILKTLDLTANRLSTISANTFTGLTNVRTLDLTNVSIAFMEPGAFNGLYNLQSLILSHNNITELKTETFNQTSRMTQLELSHNKIERIAPGALQGLNGLHNLDFTPFRLTTIEANIFTGLTNVRTLDLTNLSISTVESGAFNGLYNLQSLILSHNNITELLADTFNQTSRLTQLKLSHNKIDRIAPGAFRGLIELENLDFTSWKLSSIDTYTFMGLTNVRTLNLNNLSISSMASGAFNGLYNLQSLILSNNNIKEVQTDTFNQTKLLTKLDLSRNKIERIAPGAFNSLDKLESLNLANNELKHLHCEMTEHSLSDMRSLNLSINKISTIDVCAFSRFEKLTLLDFSFNNMTKVLRGTFSPLAELEQLIMSNNRLRYLEPALVFPLLELRQLDVSGNLLQDWDAKSVVSHLHHLTHLDFSSNKWDCIYLTQVLHYLAEKHVSARPNHEPVYDMENVNGIRCADLHMQVNQSGDAGHNDFGLQSLTNKNKTVLEELIDFLGPQFTDIIKILKTSKNSQETVNVDKNLNFEKINKVNQRVVTVDDGFGLQTPSNENKTEDQFKLGFEVLKDTIGLKLNEIIKILKTKNSQENVSIDEKVQLNKNLSNSFNNRKNIADHKLVYVTENLRILYIMSILMLISVSIIFSFLIIKLYLKTRGTCVTKRCASDSEPATSQLLDTYNL